MSSDGADDSHTQLRELALAYRDVYRVTAADFFKNALRTGKVTTQQWNDRVPLLREYTPTSDPEYTKWYRRVTTLRAQANRDTQTTRLVLEAVADHSHQRHIYPCATSREDHHRQLDAMQQSLRSQEDCMQQALVLETVTQQALEFVIQQASVPEIVIQQAVMTENVTQQASVPEIVIQQAVENVTQQAVEIVIQQAVDGYERICDTPPDIDWHDPGNAATVTIGRSTVAGNGLFARIDFPSTAPMCCCFPPDFAMGACNPPLQWMQYAFDCRQMDSNCVTCSVWPTARVHCIFACNEPGRGGKVNAIVVVGWQSLTLYAIAPIKPGEEIFITYGGTWDNQRPYATLDDVTAWDQAHQAGLEKMHISNPTLFMMAAGEYARGCKCLVCKAAPRKKRSRK